MIKYKIIEVNEKEHSIVVRYYTDKITEESLAVDILDGVIRRGRTDYSMDLPIPAPTGQDLHDFIILRAPFNWFKTQESVIDPEVDTNLDNIKLIMNMEFSGEQPITPENIPTNTYNTELVNAVHKILVDFEVIPAPPV